MVHFEVPVKCLNQKNLYEHRNSLAGSQKLIQYNIIFVIPFRNPNNLNREKFLLKVLIIFPMQINQNSAICIFSLTKVDVIDHSHLE